MAKTICSTDGLFLDWPIPACSGARAHGSTGASKIADEGPSVLKALLPSHMTTSEKVGRAMLVVAKRGAPTAVLENRDINALG
jgi:hypothetical protein